MKKMFEPMLIEIILFQSADVIATSGNIAEDDDRDQSIGTGGSIVVNPRG